MELPNNLQLLMLDLESDFQSINNAVHNIKNKLQGHSDGKLLKGDEIVGWLGEVYGKMLLNGTLVSDTYEYDLVSNNRMISIKARKGLAKNWQNSSSIPRVEGIGCPTHLLFIHLADNYDIHQVWLYTWEYLASTNRFLQKKVRGHELNYYIRVNPSIDKNYLIFTR